MKTFYLFILFCLFPLLIYSADAHSQDLRILYPSDRSVVKWERLRVVGLTINPSIKSVSCQVKGGEVIGRSSVPVSKRAFSIPIRLKKGINDITILDEKGVFSTKISIFFTQEEAKPPDGFKTYYTHFPIDKEDSCHLCHNLKEEYPDYKKMIPSATCTTGQCHVQMGKGKFVHGPVGSGTCIACHNPHGTTNKNMVTRKGEEGCYICHETERDEFKGKVVHSPIAGGDCSDCHDPHQSDLKFQLKGVSQQGLCFNCHDSALVKKSNLHTPLKEGGCTVCHYAHSSPNERLLKAPMEKVCFICHEETQKGLLKKYVHKPVKENCQKCHDPHSASQKGLLRKVEAVLCIECHKSLHPKTIQALSKPKFPHQPVNKGECKSCHSPHFTDFEKLLNAPMKDICLTCHKDLKEKVNSSKFFHGPVAQSDCAACHETHGSAYPKILKNYFPAEFYVSYKTENYSICFDCHSKDIALEAKTSRLTDFRNGDQNLHFVHVNKEKKGRSCKACHEAHSGNQPKHIREEVPYGRKWSYPIRYTKTSTGGTCVVGCHKPFSYDRVKPVKY